jgi:hypothetical protein
MKINIQTLGTAALLPAALLALTSCSSTPPGEGTTTLATQKGVPGGIMVQTYKITATVTAVDAASRQVTLVTRDGAKTTFTAGPDVMNFNQIQVGDLVKATAAEQVAVSMRKNGEPASDGEAAAVALAPVGAKPGVVMANTREFTAKVEAMDLEHRKATLRFPNGQSETFEVRKDVDMTKAKLGDEVVFRATEALAISIEKP